MARYTGPTRKYERRFGLIEEENKPQRRVRRKKVSQYGTSLEQKQKLKFIYGVLEKQFRGYYEKALKTQGNTEEVFVQLLETRLDNVVYRLGLARTRAQARQFVNHGHVLVDDKKVTVPSYHVREGQTITLRKNTLELTMVQESLEEAKHIDTVPWLDKKGPIGKVKALPSLNDVQVEVDVPLIIEYYSR